MISSSGESSRDMCEVDASGVAESDAVSRAASLHALALPKMLPMASRVVMDRRSLMVKVFPFFI
jgi:hypothetical protein